jgi:hypothetical protein
LFLLLFFFPLQALVTNPATTRNEPQRKAESDEASHRQGLSRRR